MLGVVFGAQKLCSTPFRCKLRSERLSSDTTTCREPLDDAARQAAARNGSGPPMAWEAFYIPARNFAAQAPSKTLEKTPAGGRRTPTKRENEKSLRGSHLSAASAARPCATAAGSWLVPTRVSCTFSWQQSAAVLPACRTPHAWRYLVRQLAMLCAPRRRAARHSSAGTGASPSCDRNGHRHRRTTPQSLI